ncbi:MAG: excinuclease ABC subunit UvrC [Lachnospiraceae bacterium]|nr:excinuclease ABC subunit UvrC [Lachnospiraceae bacterium]
MFVIEDELKKLPASPGVYLMHDKTDEIIYVGKAISLKNRVRQYFQTRKRSPKIEQMIKNIAYFEYIVTDSEMEALILECNLIKEHRPKYNTMLMDDKTYPYLKVTVNEPYPRVLLTRRLKRDKAKYFGPYTSVESVKDTLELLTKIFKIRTCSKKFPRDLKKERPCLNYDIKRCDAPCQGYISEEDYNKKIEKIIAFLNGYYDDIIKELERTMKRQSAELEFEEAAKTRDLLSSVKFVAQKQKMSYGERENRDVIACAKENKDAVVQVFFIRDGKLMGRDHFYINVMGDETESEIIGSFIKQYYAGTPFIPKQLLLQTEIEDMDLIANWLSDRLGQKVSIVVPKRGDKEKMIELAEKNAKLVLEKDKEKIKKEQQKTIGAVKEIVEILGIEKADRIESYDISNIAGFDSVGSMVVYEKGKPKKNDYRKFKIKWVEGPNDYASLAEVLRRRFTHESKKANDSFNKLPDLIMMDGGKGQVSVAKEVFEELGLNIDVCGMVKDDNHNTRGLYYEGKEVPISRFSEAFKLITRIQDETHRFAIEYHRAIHGKNQLKSVLDDIEGVGPTRRRALMKYFKTIEAIKEATAEEITKAPSMNEKVAKSIYDFFHEDNKS